jgi:flagellin
VPISNLATSRGCLTPPRSLTGVSNLLSKFRDTLVQLSGNNVQPADAANYQVTLKSDIQGIANLMNSSHYNGKSLLDSSAATIFVAQDGSGSTYSIGAQSLTALTTTLATLTAAATATTALMTTGGLATLEKQVGTSLNQIGANLNYVSSQTTFNSNKIDALNSGLGSLIDADLAKESAQLTALQIRQQLGTQALSLANQAPQTLLSLFK